MTDYSELKRLAEAFPADLDFDSNTEPFFNGPSGESLGGGSTGFYSVYGKPFLIEGDDYEYDGHTYVETCKADFAKFMVAARDGVLSLIAENERLKNRLEVDPRHDYDGISTRDATVKVLDEQVDQLKAENAGLKTGYEAYERVNAELKAEVEGLRREREGKVLCDLELFETLRDSANTEADEHRQCMATYRPLRQANLDSVVKKCDDLLAAMTKGDHP